MARIGAGDREAFESLYDRYGAPVMRFLHGLCSSDEPQPVRVSDLQVDILATERIRRVKDAGQEPLKPDLAAQPLQIPAFGIYPGAQSSFQRLPKRFRGLIVTWHVCSSWSDRDR